MLPGRFLYDSMFGIDRMEDMSCDIYEKDNVYHLEMDIPGFTRDDIKIECHKGTITVSAEKNVEKDESDEEKKYIRRERKCGKYKRSFYLGDIDEDSIKAESFALEESGEYFKSCGTNITPVPFDCERASSQL